MRRAQHRGYSPTRMSPRPLSRESSAQPSSVLEDCDGDSIMSTSRPPSLALMPPSSACSNPASPPSLRDILTNIAPPPYTLGAFTAFLSQNHCMETLEFTMDADRYSTAYFNFLMEQAAGLPDGMDHVCSLWQKIINAYILPYGLREVNLPSHVRDRLLSLRCTPAPPHPSELDEAVRIVYELMNDSVLGPFIASVAPQHDWSGEHDPRHTRSRLRIPKDSSSSLDDSSRSPKISFLPMLNMPWTSEPKSSASSSSESADRALTDGTANTPSPVMNEPMTPPTTPPVSDWEFNTSPGGLHKSTSLHSSSWKKGSQVMPIPDDSVTTSPDCAQPAALEALADDDKALTEKRSFRMSGDWEEPHPGQRYAITVVGSARPGVAANTNGVGKAGMAAKAYSPYPTRGWAVGNRRFAPPRMRTPALRPLKIPQDNARLSTYTTNSISTPTSTSHMLPRAPATQKAPVASPLCCPLLGRVNSKTASRPGTPISPAPAYDHESIRLSMTDFSGFLEPGLTTVTTSSTDACSFMSIDPTPTTATMTEKQMLPENAGVRLDPDPDPYGWDAELEKRVTVPPAAVVGLGLGGIDVDDGSGYCPVIQYRRAGGGRKTLLQRVLSFGPSGLNGNQ
ncbi:hypothetical protein F5144DRAFT_595203 [Chaetomium tenue]|uniref:Uncharacterized protein n=1 Tax=Chaetomium tenue TaxID=1854479 RepID=A0ACB7P2R8_9PEZI|nr:hypothetical protein F5144DRAFT_595203 [Chaetomium globosum]